MAFCTKCGRELTPGQICVCQRNYSGSSETGGEDAVVGRTLQNAGDAERRSVNRTAAGTMGTKQQDIGEAPHQSTQTSSGIKGQSAAIVSNVFEVLLAILKTPVSAGRKVVMQGKVAVGVYLIILQAVFTGLFGMVMISKINELIAGAAGSSSTSLLEYASASVVKFSYLKGFIISVLGSAALSFLVALIAMLLLMLFRGKTTYTGMILAAGVRCAGMLPVTMLSILVSIFNAGWGIVVFMVSAVIGYIFMGRVLTAGSTFLENRVPYVVFLLIILTIIVQYFMISKVWPLYLPDVLRASYYDYLREMKNGTSGLSSLFKDILN